MSKDKSKQPEPLPSTAENQPTQLAIASYASLPQTAIDRPVCSWPLDTTEGRARLHQAITGESLSLWDLCERDPVTISVTDIAAHFAAYESDDGSGEMIAGPMITLVAPEGMFHTGSPNVYESLRQLMMLEGLPPWNPPVRLRISRAPTRNKRMRCVVAYVGR